MLSHPTQRTTAPPPPAWPPVSEALLRRRRALTMRRRVPTAEDYAALGACVVEIVADVYDLPPAALLAQNRAALRVEARRVCFRLLYEEGCSLLVIGHLMQRDHTTVLHGLQSQDLQISHEEEDCLQMARAALARRLGDPARA